MRKLYEFPLVMPLNQIKNLFCILGLAMICGSATIAQTLPVQLPEICKTNESFSSVDKELKDMKKDIVVLLHGIARTKRSMHTVEKALLKSNYQVLNIDYPSTKKNITEITPVIFDEIKRLSQENDVRVHFVAYSMGCLIVRDLLAKHPFPNIGNVVMLAPPNQGSEVADFLKDNLLYKYFYGPAGKELTTDFARKNPFPKMQHTFGVIAGNVCLDPLCYFILPKGNDGKVTIEGTKLEGMSDHIILPCSHTFIIQNKAAIDQVKYFLKNRQFNHADTK